MANVAVIQPAEVPARPITPRKGRNILLGMLFGAIAGLGVAFFSEYTSESFSTRESPRGNWRCPCSRRSGTGLTGPCTSILSPEEGAVPDHPDPEFLYLSPGHKEALGAIAYGVEQRKGIIAVTGQVGTGKTTILRTYLDKADPERVKSAYLFNPNVSFPSLLQTIFRELGIPPGSDETSERVDRFIGT